MFGSFQNLAIIFFPLLFRTIEAVDHLREDFLQIKSELKYQLNLQAIQLQENMIKYIETVKDYVNIIDNFIEVNENVPMTEKVLVQDLHTDVVFIGFPSTAVHFIQEKWFESLGRFDDVMTSLNGNRATHLPGKVKVRHNIHPVHVSFHVADAIRDRLHLLLIEAYKTNSENSLLYLNAIEVESILETLLPYISLSQSDKIDEIEDSTIEMKEETKYPISAATFFILDLNLLNIVKRPILYHYLDGFSESDLSLLSSQEDIIEICYKIQNEKKKIIKKRNT